MKNYKYIILILLFLIPNIVFGAISDPISYYNFDDNSNDSIGTKHGTDYNIIYGTIPNCMIETCATFNGSTSYITKSNNDNNDDMSLSFWVYVTNFGSATTIIYHDWVSPYNVLVYLDNSDNSINLQLNGVAGTKKSSLSSATWYHVVVIRDGSNGYLYVDNVQGGSTITSLSDIGTISSDVTLGRNGSLSQSYASMRVDELAEFDYALTTNDIEELYNSGNGITYPFYTATSTATSTTTYYPTDILMNYTNDLTMITGIHYTYATSSLSTTSAQTPVEVTIDYYHIPLFFYLVIALPFLWLASRFLLEFIIRFRI